MMRKALYLLAQLNDDDIEWMLTVGTHKHVQRGTVLVREGEPTEAMYLVLEGQFRVTTGAPGNRELARLAPGEIVGEMSFIDTRAPSATVTAVQDSTVFLLDRARLGDRLGQDVSFAARFYYAIAVLLARRMRTTISTLGYGTGGIPDAAASTEDEIDLEDLHAASLAGARLDRIMRYRPDRTMLAD